MATYPTVIERTAVIDALCKLRQEWMDASEGRSLLSIQGNVALLLTDVTMSIGLDAVEQAQVFGTELAQELDDVLAVKPGSNGNH